MFENITEGKTERDKMYTPNMIADILNDDDFEDSNELMEVIKEYDDETYINNYRYRVDDIVNLLNFIWKEINGNKTKLYFSTYYSIVIGNLDLDDSKQSEFFMCISEQDDHCLKDPNNIIVLVSYESINIFAILCDTYEKLAKFVDVTRCVMTVYNIMIKYFHKFINNELSIEDKEWIYDEAVTHGLLKSTEEFTESKFDELLTNDDSNEAYISLMGKSSEFISRVINESGYTKKQLDEATMLLNNGAALYSTITSNTTLKSKEILKKIGWYDGVKQETSSAEIIVQTEDVSVDESKTAVGFVNLILRIINESEKHWNELIKKYESKYKGLNNNTVVFTIIDSISDISRIRDIYDHSFKYQLNDSSSFQDAIKKHRTDIVRLDEGDSQMRYNMLFATDYFGFYDNGPIMSVTGFIDNIVHHIIYLKREGYSDDMVIEAYKIIITHEMGHVIDRFNYLNKYPYYEMIEMIDKCYDESDEMLDKYYEMNSDERPLFLDYYYTQIPAEKMANEYVGITLDDIKFSEGWGIKYFKRK